MRWFLTVIVPASFIFFITPAHANFLDNPDPIPGWVHEDELSVDSNQKHGIKLSGKDVIFSSPVIAEIDGDTTNGKEVAVGGSDGRMYVYKADGTLLWEKDTPITGCNSVDAKEKLLSAPSVGELFGDGIPYVVIGYGGRVASTCDGGVVAMRGSDGSRRWTFSTKKWAKNQGYSERIFSVISSPALADTDNDGTMEIGFGAFDRNVYLLEATGRVRWYYHAADTVWSSPAFVDINADGRLEMIIGTDITANSLIIPPTKNGGFVYAFKTNRRPAKRIGFQDTTGYFWRKYFDQVIFSSPVVADVLPTNAGQEILIGSGCFFPQGSTAKKGKWVKILRLSNGRVLKTLRAAGCFSSSVAVGDLDDDGILEIAATVNGPAAYGGDGKSRIQVWKATDSNPIWSVIPFDAKSTQNDPYGGDLQSPIIADLDGNGSLEVIAANFWTVSAFKGTDGTPLTFQKGQPESPDVSMFAWKTLKSTPAVGDINNDNVLDLVIAGGHNYKKTNGFLYGWTNIGALMSSDAGAQTPYSAPWPMFRGNANRNGVHVP